MREVVIVSGVRTAVGRFGGAFKDVSAPDLGAAAMKEALHRAGIDPASVDEVLLGNVLQVNDMTYGARQASLRAGIPESVPAIAVNRWCSSGLEAINMAAQLIMTGEADICVAGGIENMSQSPFLLPYQSRFDGLRFGDVTMKDGVQTGITCPVNFYPMGVTAENVATRFEVSREAQDRLAFLSQQRAAVAMKEGRFQEQIVPVKVPQRRGEALSIAVDEHPRADTTMEALGRLKPAFKDNGTVTAGNSAGINDGAAAVVVMAAEKARELGVRPRLRWIARGVAGVDPSVMGIGPVPAIRKVLSKAGLTLRDIDLVELNEAFAAQAAYCVRELGLSEAIVNPNGSGIALGHPIGATGAILTVKAMHELERSGGRRAIVTMCVGGGQGVATILERVG